MCGSCSTELDSHTRRWTTSRLVVWLFLTALVAVSIAGVAGRLRTAPQRATSNCSHVGAETTAYQVTVTRDLRDGNQALLRDTDALVRHVRAENALGCAQLRSFVSGAQTTLRVACAPCAMRLRRTVGRA